MTASSKPLFAPPVSLRLLWMGALAVLAGPCHGLTLYEFGNPKAEEQLFIELINRARADPHGEGVRLATTTDPAVLSAYTQIYKEPYWTVNLNVMKAEFDLLAAQPPLAPNSCLTTSARSHSAWMLATSTQVHNETNPSNTPYTRMTAAGYVYTSAAENIYASANSVWFGHAGFEVDWGPGTDGMQAGRGHRANIHSPLFREIGVGVTLGSNGVYPNSVGPLLVTQDFGTSTANPTLATGVAYYDLNANNFYDIGEGISGLTVNVSGTGVTQYCTTAIGGGWVVPIPTTATTRTVTFSGLNMNQNVNLVVAAAKNAKADLQLTYAPPTITSSASVSAGISHTLAFTAIGGATSYKWNRWNLTDAPDESCDNTANVTTSTTGGYAVHSTSIKQQGDASWHLENPTGANQSIQLNSLYYGQSTPSLVFSSRIAAATTAEFFKVQVKEEGGSTWQDVFSHAGTNGYGESTFTQHSATFGSMTGKAFRVRFLLNSTGSYYQTGSGNTFGWFIDAITFTGTSTLGNNVMQTLTVTNGSFTPSAGTYLMSVTPVISERDYPASYQTLTATSKTPATVTLGSLAVTYNGSPKPATASTTPNGLAVTVTYDGSATAPTDAGSYAVVGTIIDSNYQGGASATLVIAKVPATVTLGSLTATYNGSPKNATATTTPGGLTVTYTYNNSPAAPTDAGSYVVIGTINDPNYQGSASGTLVISAPPVILSQPVSSTIQKNTDTATLTVVASGADLSYKWYKGYAGDTTTQVATGASYITPILPKATSYWVCVSNAAGSVNSRTSTISVSSNPVTRSFATWASEIEIANSLTANSIANAQADYDHDGRSNLLEYAFGASPIISNDATPRMPVARISPTHFILQYQRDISLTDLTFTAQTSADLTHWKAPGEIAGFTDTLISASADGMIETREAKIPRASANGYLRMRISQP